ncbi:MAG: cysteine methyltransferase [Chloroflexi bacterium]|nr:MAG: cysteine methyltransferase [Chloroflexota bacterium]
MAQSSLKDAPVYERIYALVRQIPPGKVTTYGKVAQMTGGCTARMVGYAMAALDFGTDVPWQRVINAQGKISPRAGGSGGALQRQILESEGVEFSAGGRVDFAVVGWRGPDWAWLETHGYYPPD